LLKPVALWVLCHPEKINQLQDFLVGQFKFKIFKESNIKCLSAEQIALAQNHLGCDKAGRPYLEVIQQYSGDMVTIPPGWPHMVVNVQVNFFQFF